MRRGSARRCSAHFRPRLSAPLLGAPTSIALHVCVKDVWVFVRVDSPPGASSPGSSSHVTTARASRPYFAGALVRLSELRGGMFVYAEHRVTGLPRPAAPPGVAARRPTAASEWAAPTLGRLTAPGPHLDVRRFLPLLDTAPGTIPGLRCVLGVAWVTRLSTFDGIRVGEWTLNTSDAPFVWAAPCPDEAAQHPPFDTAAENILSEWCRPLSDLLGALLLGALPLGALLLGDGTPPPRLGAPLPPLGAHPHGAPLLGAPLLGATPIAIRAGVEDVWVFVRVASPSGAATPCSSTHVTSARATRHTLFLAGSRLFSFVLVCSPLFSFVEVWKLGILETWRLGNSETWKLGNLET